MKLFDEEAFIYALTQRDEDAKDMQRLFKADWLHKKELVPVLNAIYDFLKEYKATPSIASLHEHMEERDKAKYDARYKTTLTAIAYAKYDNTKQMQAIRKAREAAASYSLSAVIHSQNFQTMLNEGNGDGLLGEMSHWLGEHTQADGEGIYNIREAFDKLVTEMPWDGRSPRIGTGIQCIDEWNYGGLRKGQLGIIMAPTGEGKSTILMNIAHHVAVVEQKPVLFVTNELTIDEQAERFLARMQAPEVDANGNEFYHTLREIQEDPTVAYRGMERKWEAGIEGRLFVISVDLNTTADMIEAHLSRMRAEYGFVPATVVIDFMERMKPTSNVSKDKEWIFIGEIAKELVRLGKRRKSNVWTAIQTNRSGLSRGAVQDMSQAQSSIRQLQEAATVVGVRKVYVEMDASGDHKIECLAFKELKQRHSPMMDREVLLRVMLERMVITKEEVIPPSDEAIVDGQDEDEKQKDSKPRRIKGQKEVKGK
jgi:hypothetical protein